MTDRTRRPAISRRYVPQAGAFGLAQLLCGAHVTSPRSQLDDGERAFAELKDASAGEDLRRAFAEHVEVQG